MKFTPEVIAALAVLRKNAENDFEHHRINALEYDLTDSLKVADVIDENTQSFKGLTFKKNRSGHYVCFISLHRAMWIYYRGALPNGKYDIHHIDFDKDNNRLDNFQLLASKEHQRLHRKFDKLKTHVCDHCGKKFVSRSSRARCCSKQCIQALHYEKNHELRTCAFCGKEFAVYRHSKTKCCSASCAAKLRQPNPLPAEKICPICGKSFKPKSHSHTCCSKSCGLKLSHQKQRQAPIETTCPMCGKKFILVGKDPRTVCCSRSCSAKWQWHKRKSQQSPAQQKLF